MSTTYDRDAAFLFGTRPWRSMVIVGAVCLSAALVLIVLNQKSSPASKTVVNARTNKDIREAMSLSVFLIRGAGYVVPGYKGHFPPSTLKDDEGHPMNSWRFYVWSTTLHAFEASVNPVFRGRWNLPQNLEFAESIGAPWTYSWSRRAIDKLRTNNVAVVDSGTAFDPDVKHKVSDVDGDTILLVEVEGLDIQWMQPGDVSLSWISKALDSGESKQHLGIREGSFHVAFADREVWRLRGDIPFATLQLFLKVDSALQNDREELLAPYRIVSEEVE